MTVTARVMPCKPLFISLAIFCQAVVFLGMLYLLSFAGTSLPLLMRLLIGCCALMAGCTASYILYTQYRVHWLHINFDGQILWRQETVARVSTVFSMDKAQTVHLLPDSTLLPYVMLLRLQCASGRIVPVCITPGAVDDACYRQLSVASRRILGR